MCKEDENKMIFGSYKKKRDETIYSWSPKTECGGDHGKENEIPLLDKNKNIEKKMQEI